MSFNIKVRSADLASILVHPLHVRATLNTVLLLKIDTCATKSSNTRPHNAAQMMTLGLRQVSFSARLLLHHPHRHRQTLLDILPAIAV
jgi:hypothetical protein